jgi:inositol transport system permease protein
VNNIERNNIGGLFRVVFRKYAILLALIILMLVLSIMTDKFMTQDNLINILRQISVIAILAMAATFVIITGGIDLSCGSLLALCGVVFAMYARGEESGADPIYPLIIPIVIAVVIGLTFGALNGVLVSVLKLAPFIVTLGTMTIARGTALLISNGRPISDMSGPWKDFGKNGVGIFPYLVIVMIVAFIITAIVLNKTKYGRYLYAIGGNEEAARASGIRTLWVKLSVYVLAGGLVAVAGILQATRMTVGQPNVGSGYELQAISAVVIGGTSLSGGTGAMWGTLVGAVIIGVLNNGLDLMGVSSFWQQIVSGIIIIAAVLLDIVNKKSK